MPLLALVAQMRKNINPDDREEQALDRHGHAWWEAYLFGARFRVSVWPCVGGWSFDEDERHEEDTGEGEHPARLACMSVFVPP